MKEWFPYLYGFVNCTDDFIYFTKSGNWSETKTLKEKSTKTIRKSSYKSQASQWIVGILSLGYVYVYFTKVSLDKPSISSAIGIIPLIAGIYFTFKRFEKDMGLVFGIPIQKIQKITFEPNNTVVHFSNGDGINDSYRVTGISEKGIATLREIQSQLPV